MQLNDELLIKPSSEKITNLNIADEIDKFLVFFTTVLLDTANYNTDDKIRQQILYIFQQSFDCITRGFDTKYADDLKLIEQALRTYAQDKYYQIIAIEGGLDLFIQK